MPRIYGLQPIIGSEPRVLILGTMPGAESLARQQYYANTRNVFWRFVESWSGAPSTAYEARCSRLSSARIGLWDVLAECDRDGSSAASIGNPVPNDFAGLFSREDRLRHVLFNGQTARRLFDGCRIVVPASIELITLPSTSPANARPGRIEAWRATLETVRR